MGAHKLSVVFRRQQTHANTILSSVNFCYFNIIGKISENLPLVKMSGYEQVFCSYDSVVLVIVSSVNSSGCGYAVVSYTSGVVTVCNRPFACKDSKVCNNTSRVQSQHQLLKYG